MIGPVLAAAVAFAAYGYQPAPPSRPYSPPTPPVVSPAPASPLDPPEVAPWVREDDGGWPTPHPGRPGVDDALVWVDSGTYVYPGSPRWGHTPHGEYLHETDALARGYHAAHHRYQGRPVHEGGSVWVDQETGGFCYPDSPGYGRSPHGETLSEAEALAKGYRAVRHPHGEP